MPKLGATLSTSDINSEGEVNPTPGSAVTIDVTSSTNQFRWTASQNETVNISGSHNKGKEIVLIIINDGILPRVITFGNGFVSSGVVTGIASLTSIVSFQSDGTNFLEKSRVIAI